MTAANSFEKMFAYYLKSADNIISHFNEDKEKRNLLLEKLQVAVSSHLKNSMKMQKMRETLDLFKLNHDEKENILELFGEKKAELFDYNPDVSSDLKIKEYEMQVQNLLCAADGVIKKSNNDDEELEFTQDEVNVIDPFTKKRMISPVKNHICGHVYDHETLQKILKFNKNTRCPVVGCSNKEPIAVDHVLPDMVTKRYLQENPE